MTTSRVRAPVSDLAEGERVLDRDTGHYLTRVRRLPEGARFVAFDPRAAREADATILRAAEPVLVRMEKVRPAAIVAPRHVTVIQGLPKGPKADAVVRDATELGATAIILATSARSVVRLEGRVEARVERWEKIAREAARQCERADVPSVRVLGFADALASVPRETARLCLWERATLPVGVALRRAIDEGAPLAFAIGPEGGLDDAEVEAARDAGFLLVSLGALILRTETVATALLGAVRVLADPGPPEQP